MWTLLKCRLKKFKTILKCRLREEYTICGCVCNSLLSSTVLSPIIAKSRVLHMPRCPLQMSWRPTFNPHSFHGFWPAVCNGIMMVHVILFLFNICFPCYPLDGGRALVAILLLRGLRLSHFWVSRGIGHKGEEKFARTFFLRRLLWVTLLVFFCHPDPSGRGGSGQPITLKITVSPPPPPSQHNLWPLRVGGRLRGVPREVPCPKS